MGVGVEGWRLRLDGAKAICSWSPFWEACCEQGAARWMRAPSMVRGLETIAFEESF